MKEHWTTISTSSSINTNISCKSYQEPFEKTHCFLCKIDIIKIAWQRHLNSVLHKQNESVKYDPRAEAKPVRYRYKDHTFLDVEQIENAYKILQASKMKKAARERKIPFQPIKPKWRIEQMKRVSKMKKLEGISEFVTRKLCCLIKILETLPPPINSANDFVYPTLFPREE